VGLTIDQAMFDEIIAHARDDLPNECCGLVATKDGEAMATYRCRNIMPSSGSFEMDPLEQIALFGEIHAQGWVVGAFYHSHPTIDPVPSSVDISYSEAWPGVMWIIVGWRHFYRRIKGEWIGKREGSPDVWAWMIEDERVTTSELVVRKTTDLNPNSLYLSERT
jgi:proteasome lid subunit RPN8/RPN11